MKTSLVTKEMASFLEIKEEDRVVPVFCSDLHSCIEGPYHFLEIKGLLTIHEGNDSPILSKKWSIVGINSKHLRDDTLPLITFDKGWVIASGTLEEMSSKRSDLEKFPQNKMYSGGNYETIVSGAGTLSVVGEKGKVFSGEYSQAISGHRGFSKVFGRLGQAVTFSRGKSVVEAEGQSISFIQGESISGKRGTSLSGAEGKSSSGKYGKSITGINGMARAGEGGVIIIDYNEDVESLIREEIVRKTKVGYIGEDGLKPDTWYRLNENHDFEEVKESVDEHI